MKQINRGFATAILSALEDSNIEGSFKILKGFLEGELCVENEMLRLREAKIQLETLLHPIGTSSSNVKHITISDEFTQNLIVIINGMEGAYMSEKTSINKKNHVKFEIELCQKLQKDLASL